MLGNNKTGLVTDANTPAIGGEDPQYAVNTLAEGPEVYQGSYTTTSTYYFPTATVAKWDQYIKQTSTPADSKLTQNGAASGKTASAIIFNVLVSVAASSFVSFMWLF